MEDTDAGHNFIFCLTQTHTWTQSQTRTHTWTDTYNYFDNKV